MFHKLTASNRKEACYERQRTTNAPSTSPSHTLGLKLNMKGDNRAEAGQASAKNTSKASQLSQCPECF
jgi:hypothetical protein